MIWSHIEQRVTGRQILGFVQEARGLYGVRSKHSRLVQDLGLTGGRAGTTLKESNFEKRRFKMMSLEWFQAMLGAVFVGVWLIVGQIVATDRH